MPNQNKPPFVRLIAVIENIAGDERSISQISVKCIEDTEQNGHLGSGPGSPSQFEAVAVVVRRRKPNSFSVGFSPAFRKWVKQGASRPGWQIEK